MNRTLNRLSGLKKVILKRKLPLYIALLMISAIPPMLLWGRISWYKLPVGGDWGGWLKMSYAVFGVNYPMWGQNPLQGESLPLFLIIYPLAQLLGDVSAINVISIALIALRPVTVFILAKTVLKDDTISLICAGVDSFVPSYYEMFGWGGGPNLLGFILMPLAFYKIVKTPLSMQTKDFVQILFLSTLVILSHHLTSMIFLATIYLWVLFQINKDRKFAIKIVLAVSLPFLIYRLLVGGTSEWVFFNEFAFSRTITYEAFLWTFKNPAWFVFLLILSCAGIYEIYRASKEGSSTATFLLCWVSAPILIYIGTYCTRLMAIDYVRLLFFLPQPLIVGAGGFLIFLRKKSKFLSLGIVCILLLATVPLGYTTMNKAIAWNKHMLESRYSDEKSYDMVMWVKENVPDDAVIVTRLRVLNRYIEGMSHKRVLAWGALKQLFKQNQYQMSLATGAILSSTILGYSDMFMIKDQTPTLFSRTPYIYLFSGGDYSLLGYFSDHYPLELKELTSNVTQINISNSSYQFIYSDSYYTSKIVTLKNDEVQVSYKILKDPYKVSREKLGKPLYSHFLLPWGTNWKFENNTLVTDYGNVEVVTDAISVQKEYVPKWKQWRLVFSFNDELSVTFKVKDTRMVKGNTILTTSDDLIKQYGVTHALIRVDDKEAMKWAEALGWKLVYNNDLFYLYSLS